MSKRIIAMIILFLVINMALAKPGFDDKGNPNDPRVNDRANACYEGASMEGKCFIEYDWELGWYVIRLEFGLLSAEQIPSWLRPATSLGPTETPLVPTETPLAPTETPLVPTETPLVPTETPLVPTETPLVPTETPLVPTETPSICALVWNPNYYVDFSQSNFVSAGNYWSDSNCTVSYGDLARNWVYSPSGQANATSICVANLGAGFTAVPAHGPLTFECRSAL